MQEELPVYMKATAACLRARSALPSCVHCPSLRSCLYTRIYSCKEGGGDARGYVFISIATRLRSCSSWRVINRRWRVKTHFARAPVAAYTRCLRRCGNTRSGKRLLPEYRNARLCASTMTAAARIRVGLLAQRYSVDLASEVILPALICI